MIRRTKLTFDAQRWKAEEALAREGVSIMVCAGTGLHRQRRHGSI